LIKLVSNFLDIKNEIMRYFKGLGFWIWVVTGTMVVSPIEFGIKVSRFGVYKINSVLDILNFKCLCGAQPSFLCFIMQKDA
jgi:hypothetical protein